MQTAPAPPTIVLWSFHEPRHSPLTGKVDHSRSQYRDDAGIMAAYAELHRRLGTDQLIWCYTNKENFQETSIEMTEWAFKVPVTGVLAFYDSMVWTRIIGKPGTGLTRTLRQQFKKEALAKYGYDPKARHDYEDGLADACWKQPPPSGDWWNHLFVEYHGQDGVDALIRHPVDRMWHIGNQRRGLKRETGDKRRGRIRE
jgi:hypothetical protein